MNIPEWTKTKSGYGLGYYGYGGYDGSGDGYDGSSNDYGNGIVFVFGGSWGRYGNGEGVFNGKDIV